MAPFKNSHKERRTLENLLKKTHPILPKVSASGTQFSVLKPPPSIPTSKLLCSEIPTSLQDVISLLLKNSWISLEHTTSEKLKTVVSKFREALPNVVHKSQLIAMYANNPTLLEKEIYSLVQKYEYRVILINSGSGGSVLISVTDLHALLDWYLSPEVTGCKKSIETLEYFKQILKSNPHSTSFPTSQFPSSHRNALVQAGFLTISCQVPTLQSNSVSNVQVYSLSLPNLGTCVKLHRNALKWVSLSLSHLDKKKVYSENTLLARFNQCKDIWVRYKGIELATILLEGFGAGYWIKKENGWILTGKKL